MGKEKKEIHGTWAEEEKDLGGLLQEVVLELGFEGSVCHLYSTVVNDF